MLNIDLWHHFLEKFSAAIVESDVSHLARVWSSHKGRTQFYGEMLRPLAARLGTLVEEELETGNELFKVDFAISRTSNGVTVPVVFIESENNAYSARHEIRKLVNLAAPLRVLITVAQWDEESGIWVDRGGGHRSKLLPEWERVIREHQMVWPRAGVVGILVGEWRPDKTFRFYGYCYGEGHRLAVPVQEALLEKSVGYEDPHQALAATHVEKTLGYVC
jgi:hypothetical protein